MSNKLNFIFKKNKFKPLEIPILFPKSKEPEHSGICKTCQTFKKTIKFRRMKTYFNNENDNYIEECEECFDETQLYWQERWDDYYSSLF